MAGRKQKHDSVQCEFELSSHRVTRSECGLQKCFFRLVYHGFVFDIAFCYIGPFWRPEGVRLMKEGGIRLWGSFIQTRKGL